MHAIECQFRLGGKSWRLQSCPTACSSSDITHLFISTVFSWAFYLRNELYIRGAKKTKLFNDPQWNLLSFHHFLIFTTLIVCGILFYHQHGRDLFWNFFKSYFLFWCGLLVFFLPFEEDIGLGWLIFFFWGQNPFQLLYGVSVATHQKVPSWYKKVLVIKSYIKDIRHLEKSFVIRIECLCKTLNMHPGLHSMSQHLNFWTVPTQVWLEPSGWQRVYNFHKFSYFFVLTPLAAALLCSFRWSTFTWGYALSSLLVSWIWNIELENKNSYLTSNGF